jgi:hypothetical protein
MMAGQHLALVAQVVVVVVLIQTTLEVLTKTQ